MTKQYEKKSHKSDKRAVLKRILRILFTFAPICYIITKVNTIKKGPELLSPAGNFEKLKAAYRYGADAVYIGGKLFGMRSAADNFTVDEIFEAAKYAHARGKKLYLTVNTMPHGNEYEALRAFLTELQGSEIDAIIAAERSRTSISEPRNSTSTPSAERIAQSERSRVLFDIRLFIGSNRKGSRHT